MAQYHRNQAYNAMMRGVSQQVKEKWQEERDKERKDANIPEDKPQPSMLDILKKGLRENGPMGGTHSPKSIKVNQSPAYQKQEYSAFSAMTTKAEADDHNHIAYYDHMGNGVTGEDDTGHVHVVRSFMVSPYQHPDGTGAHNHSGPLPAYSESPGGEYRHYTGEVMKIGEALDSKASKSVDQAMESLLKATIQIQSAKQAASGDKTPFDEAVSAVKDIVKTLAKLSK